MFRHVTKPLSGETCSWVFFHQLYNPLWVLAFLTRSFQAFQFDVSSNFSHSLFIFLGRCNGRRWSIHPAMSTWYFMAQPSKLEDRDILSQLSLPKSSRQSSSSSLVCYISDASSRRYHFKGRVWFVSRADQLAFLSIQYACIFDICKPVWDQN